MNSYIPRSPEQGRSFTPPSVARRLSVTDLSAKFVVSATRGVEYTEPVEKQPRTVASSSVINFPVAKAAGVNPSNTNLSSNGEQNSSNVKTPEYRIPETSNPQPLSEDQVVTNGDVVNMDKYRMVKEAQARLEEIYGAA